MAKAAALKVKIDADLEAAKKAKEAEKETKGAEKKA